MVQVGQPFAELLKQYREQVRMSQSRLAESSGFDHSYVSRLESGHRTPTREAVIKFAEALLLAEPECDALLAAAGFMPQRVESLFSDEPILTEVFQLLQNSDTPECVRTDLRGMLELLVRQARLAALAHSSDSGPVVDTLAAD